jgi:alanine racemase
MAIAPVDSPPAAKIAARAWIEIDLGAVRHNLRSLKACVGTSQLVAVVKSDAYGHGLVEVARVAIEEGCWGLAVVNIDEGLTLRKNGFDCNLVVVGPIFPFELEAAIEADLALPVYSVEIAQAVSKTAQRLGRTVKVHLKVDTGLSRLAVPVDESKTFLELCSLLPNLDIEGLYSHYADAEGLDQSYTLKQFQQFQKAVKLCDEVGIKPRYRHISASAAALLIDEARMELVRTGISIYGLWPAEETKILMASRGAGLLERINRSFTEGEPCVTQTVLRPSLTFKTLVAQVKTLPPNTAVGYGCTYRTTRQTVIAVLPVGYYEGYDRHLSNVGEVLIRGHRARVLGRVCMNVVTVDVTDIPEVAMGDEVVLLGCQQSYSKDGSLVTSCISAEEVAKKIGTINYEVVTRLPHHLPRFYRDLA